MGGPEPTSIEFEGRFRDLMQQALPAETNRKVVVVLDNLTVLIPKTRCPSGQPSKRSCSARVVEQRSALKKSGSSFHTIPLACANSG